MELRAERENITTVDVDVIVGVAGEDRSAVTAVRFVLVDDRALAAFEVALSG